MNKFSRKFSRPGFTILELVVASTIATILITSIVATVGNLYVQQKQVAVTQRFYKESQFLLERISQTIRNNTIDYDEYFVQQGPLKTGSSADVCANFAEAQFKSADETIASRPSNDKTNRERLTYLGVFSWDIAGRTRLLGGFNPEGEKDHCVQAFDTSNSITELYLINRERTVQTILRFNDTKKEITLERRIGADVDGDSRIDVWSNNPIYTASPNTTCQIQTDPDNDTIKKDVKIHEPLTVEEMCDIPHEAVPISPKGIEVTGVKFRPYPEADPFLAFRRPEYQVHPFVIVQISTKLKLGLGIPQEKLPTLDLQTSATSRIFGNPRQ